MNKKLTQIRKANLDAVILNSVKNVIVGLVLIAPIILFLINYKPSNPLSSDDLKDLSKCCLSFEVIGEPFAETTSQAVYSYGFVSGKGAEEAESVYFPVKIKLSDGTGRIVAVDANSRDSFMISRFEKAYKTGEMLTYYGWFFDKTEIYVFLKNFAKNSGFSEEIIREYIVPYEFYVRGRIPYLRILSVIIGTGLVVLGICRLIKGLKGEYFKDFEQDILKSGCSEEEVSDDIKSAKSYDSKERLAIGEKFTYIDLSGRRPRAFLNENIEAAKSKTRGGINRADIIVWFLIKGEETPLRLRLNSSIILIDGLFDRLRTLNPSVNIGVLEKKE